MEEIKNYKKMIKEIYQGYCKEQKRKFSKNDFDDFPKFLEVDFYDWIKENLRCYFRDQK